MSRFEINGEIYTALEKMGGETFIHTGFRDPDGRFQEALESIAPDVGDRVAVRLTVEILPEAE